MQSLFSTYFELGFTHILDPRAYDHLLFLVALALPFTFGQWRAVVLLATAFTVGHSLTLALVGLGWLVLPTAWVEFSIPLTIALTAAHQLWQTHSRTGPPRRVPPLIYLLVVGFGLVHGAGFSTLFRAMALPGEDGQLWRQLLAFNLGVEAGQVLIVLGILLASTAALALLRLPYRPWNWLVGGAVFLLSLLLLIESYPR